LNSPAAMVPLIAVTIRISPIVTDYGHIIAHLRKISFAAAIQNQARSMGWLIQRRD
jgi:hypothetical protein